MYGSNCPHTSLERKVAQGDDIFLTGKTKFGKINLKINGRKEDRGQSVLFRKVLFVAVLDSSGSPILTIVLEETVIWTHLF